VATITELRTHDLALQIAGTTITIGKAPIEFLIQLTTADLPEVGKLFLRLMRDAVKAARDGGEAVPIAEIKELVDRFSDHADKLGSALIDVRTTVKEREGRLMPPGVAEVPVLEEKK
jgi:hypothetical protein